MNERLRAHVTSVSFQLSLSQTQCALLVWLNEAIEREWSLSSRRPTDLADIKALRTRGPHSIETALDRFVPGVKGLEKRGLIIHHMPPRKGEPGWDPLARRAASAVWEITTAGELTVGLLREAGVYADVLATMIRFPIREEPA